MPDSVLRILGFSIKPGDKLHFHGAALRDLFAMNERLAEWDSPDAESPPAKMCEALAGRPRPAHGWSCNTAEQYLDILRWEAEWRAALKYLRADAMLKARMSK